MTAATRTAVITGLTNGTAYQVRVRATNARGDGAWSASATQQAGAPSAPAAPTLGSGNAQITASWAAPAGNGSAITGYAVQHSTDGVLWSTAGVTVTAATRTAVITGLTNGTAYQVRVRAANDRGDGAWSASATQQAGAPSTPAAPTLTADTTSLGVSYTAPATNGSAITDYDLRYREANTSSSEWVHDPVVSYDPGSLAGTAQSDGSSGQALDLGTVALSGVTVAKVTTGGVSNVYEVGPAVGMLRIKLQGRNASSTPLTYQARYAPTAPAASDMNTHGSLLWRRTVGYAGFFSEDGQTPPLPAGSHFWITTTAAGSTDQVTPTVWADDITSSGLSQTLTGLTTGTSYEVQVRAANARGEGGWSTSATATPTPPAPGRTPSVTVARSDGKLSVSWPAVARADWYHVTYTSNGGESWDLAALKHATTTIEISGTNDALAYVVGVRAGNAAGWGGWQNSASSPATLLPPGRTPSVSVVRSDGMLSVSWPAVATATHYHVTYTSNGGESWELAAYQHATASIDVTGVDNDLAYVVGVRAGNGAGWGGWRNSAAAGPWWPPNTPPNAPASVTVSRGCGHPFTVSWAAALGATGYDVVVSSDGRKSWQRVQTNAPHTLWIVGNPSKHKTYTFGVRALNAAGHSGWTNSPPAPPPSCTLSGVRATGHATWDTSTPASPTLASSSITVSWNASHWASGYNVNHTYNGGGSWVRIATNTAATTNTSAASGTGDHIAAVQAVSGSTSSLWVNADVAWLAVTAVTTDTATLAQQNRSGAWWVKQASDPQAACIPAGSGNSFTVDQLTSSTSYTYRAYHTAGCTAAGLFAEATFTTA